MDISKRLFSRKVINFSLTSFLLLFFSILSFCPSSLGQTLGTRSEEMGVGRAMLKSNPTKTLNYYSKAGKYGFVHHGKEYDEAIYDEISHGVAGQFILKKAGKYGLADKAGKPIGQLEYDRVVLNNNWQATGYIAKKNNKYALLDQDGNLRTKLSYDSISPLNEHSGYVHYVFQKGKMGSLTATGEVLAKPLFQKVLYSGYAKKYSVITDKDDQIKILDNSSNKLEKEIMERVEVYANLIVAKSKDAFFIFSNVGKAKFPDYDQIYFMQTNNYRSSQKVEGSGPPFTLKNIQVEAPYLIVQKGSKKGLIDAAFKEIYPLQFDEISYSSFPEFITVQEDGKKGLFFPRTGIKIVPKYEEVSLSNPPYLLVREGKRYGMLNRTGKVLFEPEFDNISTFSNNRLMVTRAHRKGLIDSLGNVLVPINYENIREFYSQDFQGYLMLEEKDKYGVLDPNYQVVIPISYDFVDVLGSYFRVLKDSSDRKFGLLDKGGKLVVPVENKWIDRSATERSALILIHKTDKQMNILQTQGKLLFPEDILQVSYLEDSENLRNTSSRFNKLFLTVQNQAGKFGLVDERKESLTVPFLYDNIKQKFETKDHVFFVASKAGKYGVIDDENRELIPFVYQDLNFNYLGYEFIEKIEDHVVVAKKDGKMGAVNFKNEIIIPFQYIDLQRIARIGLFKAKKKGEGYKLLDQQNRILSDVQYDDIANFEIVEKREGVKMEGLAFLDGRMVLLDQQGKTLSKGSKMEIHQGFTTFEALKQALILALNDDQDERLKDFVEKITPSAHLMYYIQGKMLFGDRVESIDAERIKGTYFRTLRAFKTNNWKNNNSRYDKGYLTNTDDFTDSNGEQVSNFRIQVKGFGDEDLNRILSDAIKVNGYWISSYFAHPRFRNSNRYD